MPSDRPETLFTRLSAVVHVVIGGLVALFFLLAAVILSNVLGLPPRFRFWSFLVALVVLTAAYGLRTYPLYTFGIRKSVGYAVANEGRCVECGEVISTGERRRYARQAVVFGVPVYTFDWGVNTYCYDCRTGERAHTAGDETRQYEREAARFPRESSE